ncbi:MAG TPA: cation diffusion facilitator family transporter [Anaerolineales bacterium]|nr:cation diffusion facilitator family transporter [Anaerolineales bacterium]
MSHTNAQQEKSSAALSSVLFAIALTTFKIIVGLLTNSLGILAEAAHSALDLAAALMTFFAVRMADKPADKEHNFGHGKIENLSALFEALLLLATSAWIINEAADRLFFRKALVEVSVWSFLVMGTSIAIDFTRSRILYRAAKKYNSQALEADALHFSTDIWSSSVVIVGLIGVTISRLTLRLAWMSEADAIAAMVVALIVIFVSGQLGWRTINALLDTAPKGITEKIIVEVSKMRDIHDCHAVRIRPSGALWFVDLHVTMDGERTLNETHAITEKIEKKVHTILPDSDVTVHVEPFEMAEK